MLGETNLLNEFLYFKGLITDFRLEDTLSKKSSRLVCVELCTKIINAHFYLNIFLCIY